MGLCVFSLPTFLVMFLRIWIFYLIIIIKSDAWTISHCLGLGYETVVCTVCLAMLCEIDGLVQERRNSSTLAMELRLSCTNPLKWASVPWPLHFHNTESCIGPSKWASGSCPCISRTLNKSLFFQICQPAHHPFLRHHTQVIPGQQRRSKPRSHQNATSSWLWLQHDGALVSGQSLPYLPENHLLVCRENYAV